MCCFAPRLEELDKPALTRCKFQGDGCCTEYDARPSVCQSYQCAWLGGFGQRAHRPDKLGALLTARNSEALGPWVSVQVLTEGARASKAFKRAVASAAERCIVLEMLDSSMRVLGGPEEQVQAFVEAGATSATPIRRLVPLSALTRRAS